ncbi:hypothetical protein BKA69DRAFT_232708 [Paraphysoderma sedebokerense]|nr:hypothetical protein BKA69DRAFT_232708 [Paraphysoderma sedebokerense]
MSQAPFYPVLLQSFEGNYGRSKEIREPVYVQFAMARRNGYPVMHNAIFADFLQEDHRYLMFMASKDSPLLSDLRSNNVADICWTMPKTKEQFRFFVFWENERQKQWKRLSTSLRATFTWPASGEKKQDNTGYEVTSLKHLVDASSTVANAPPTPPLSSLIGGLVGAPGKKIEDEKISHDIALDNFCLVVVKVSFLDHLVWSTHPPSRTQYECGKDGFWSIQEVNP